MFSWLVEGMLSYKWYMYIGGEEEGLSGGKESLHFSSPLKFSAHMSNIHLL